MIPTILTPLLIAALITYLTTPLVIRLARVWNLVDDPRRRPHPAHTHTGIIPRAGGLAIFFGIAAAILIFFPPTKLVVGILAAAAILTVVGLVDDKGDINPYLRLMTNGLAAAMVVATGAGIPYITNPITGGVIQLDTWRIPFNLGGEHSLIVWSSLLSFLWIMWTMNIVGWSAGVDGQMPGFVTIAAITLGILSLRFSAVDPTQLWVTILAFIVAGSFLGFLPWNFYPQKIMPGYGGKVLAGYFLALLGILSFAKLGTALLVLGVPMLDAVYTLIRRLGDRRSPVWADRGHLHHRLLNLGWGKRKIALFYWVVSAILGLVALTVNSRQKLFAFLLLAVAVAMFLVWVNLFSQFSKPRDPDSG